MPVVNSLETLVPLIWDEEGGSRAKGEAIRVRDLVSAAQVPGNRL
jgi:hypothetical protein